MLIRKTYPELIRTCGRGGKVLVETICAPCGAVIAWTKFDKSESETQILKFLVSVYPTEESRPDYICIDKACRVLCTAISNGSWDRIWKKSFQYSGGCGQNKTFKKLILLTIGM